MNRDLEHIEKLLREKEFSALTPRERELVLAHLSGEEEYLHMQKTLERVRDTFKTEATHIQADADMKEWVLNRFNQNKPTPVTAESVWEKILLTFRMKPAVRFAGVLTLLLLVVTASVFFWPEPKPEMAQDLKKNEESSGLITLEDLTTVAGEKERRGGGVYPLSPQEEPVRTAAPSESRTLTDAVKAEDADNVSEDLPRAAAPKPAAVGLAESDYETTVDKTGALPAKENSGIATKKSERVREEYMLNQAPSSGKVFKPETEMAPEFSAYWPGLMPNQSETALINATQLEIAAFLSQKATFENKNDFLEKHKGKSISLTLYFHSDGRVKQAAVSGHADAKSEEWIKQWAKELPSFRLSGSIDDKNRKYRYQIRF